MRVTRQGGDILRDRVKRRRRQDDLSYTEECVINLADSLRNRLR